MRYVLLASLLIAPACGDDDDDDDDDVVVIDAAAGAIDAPASSPDAATPDATPPDATSPDAAPPDGAPACGTIGKSCDPKDSDCDSGQECMFSIGGDFCVKARDGCGGFAGATCDDPSAPFCHYLTSGTFGPCLSAFERDCVCERSPGSIEGCP